MLSGHTDVVPVDGQDWTSDPFVDARTRRPALWPRRLRHEGLHRGCAWRWRRTLPRPALTRPLHFAFTYDEEVGCLGAQAMMDELERAGSQPAGLHRRRADRACASSRATRAAANTRPSSPASRATPPQPDTGVNAVEYAVRYITRLLDARRGPEESAPAGNRASIRRGRPCRSARWPAASARNVIAGALRGRVGAAPGQPAPISPSSGSTLTVYVDDELLPAMRAVAPDAGIVTAGDRRGRRAGARSTSRRPWRSSGR